MARCPLCSERAAKRYCPAKEVRICSVCCGTKREIEIDCPGSCPFLKAARSYESEKVVPDAELQAKIHKYDQDFLYQFGPILDAVSRHIVEERFQSSFLTDADVLEVFRNLRSTMKTLASGIYYESLPVGPVRISLFRRLKGLFDELMKPQQDPNHRSLKVSEAIDVLDFLIFSAQLNSSVRPKSRRYLDWLAEMVAAGQPKETASSVIIP